jgi:hypothetical protein
MGRGLPRQWFRLETNGGPGIRVVKFQRGAKLTQEGSQARPPCPSERVLRIIVRAIHRNLYCKL